MSIEVKLLPNTGTFDLLTPDSELQRQLLTIEEAGRTCYQSDRSKITLESAAKFCKMLIERGHESVLEHSLLTVRFRQCSRAFTHELVRHRISAFSQESTRFVDYKKHDEHECVVPTITEKIGKSEHCDAISLVFRDAANYAIRAYLMLRNLGSPAQDARQVLPIGFTSEIVMSANFREWRHVFSLRCDAPAHWEIRKVMCALLCRLKPILPGVFDDFVYVGNCPYKVPIYAHLLPESVLKRQMQLRTENMHSSSKSVSEPQVLFQTKEEMQFRNKENGNKRR